MMKIREYIFKMNVRTKAFGAFIILIVISYLLYNFSITPLLEQRKRLRMSLISQKRLLETRTASITEIDSLEKALNEAKKELKDIEESFLTEEKLPSFFAKLRSLADGSNINILNLKVGEKQPLAADLQTKGYKYEQLPVNVSLAGNYLDTITFLANLREEPAIFSFSEMSIATQKGETEAIKTDLQLVLYLIQK